MPKSLGKKHEKYLRALNTLDYYFEGAMIPYILLGETAQKMKDQEDLDDLERLEIGVDKRTLSRYSSNTLRDRFGVGWVNKEHEVDGMKVFIKLIEKKYRFFKFLDKIPYWGASFHIANPFEKYWKARSLVK
jgi:hypothetical protein